jgi:ubiquinone/menaquinone biosynthesis C-methylase UbiE
VHAAKHAKSVVGIDISLEKAEERIEEGLPKKVHLIEMDVSVLDFPDEFFDAVFAYNALGHLTGSIDPSTREMIRVLKTGGDLCFFATWKMDRGILTCMEDRTPSTGMSLVESVESEEYTARVWRKQGPSSGGVWVKAE